MINMKPFGPFLSFVIGSASVFTREIDPDSHIFSRIGYRRKKNRYKKGYYGNFVFICKQIAFELVICMRVFCAFLGSRMFYLVSKKASYRASYFIKDFLDIQYVRI